MALTPMAFSPATGFEDATTYPDPASEAAARAQLQDIPNQLKTFVNSTLIAELASTAAGKGASQIGVEDSGTRYTATNVETALAEIAGSGRTTETVKGLADLISTKVNPNAIINGCFRVNQRAVSGTVTLAAGVYGHDRWKAGASGCTYTFAENGGMVTITITAGSLIQVVEGTNLETATYCLSWTGTSQGKIGSGTASASGVTGSVTGGINLSIEFGTGTLSKVKLEKGNVTTPFIKRSISEELALCFRYYYCTRYISGDSQVPLVGYGFGASATSVNILINSPTYFRAVPSLSYGLISAIRVIDASVSSVLSPTAVATDAASNRSCVVIKFTLSSVTANRPYWADLTANGYIGLDAEIY